MAESQDAGSWVCHLSSGSGDVNAGVIKSALIALMPTAAAVLHGMDLPQQTVGSNARSDADFVQLMERFADAWNRHDLDALMSMMAADCVFEASAGPQLAGQRSEGKQAAAPHTPRSSRHFLTRTGPTPDISSPASWCVGMDIYRHAKRRQARGGDRLRPLQLPRRQNRYQELVSQEPPGGVSSDAG
jgi:ketosteroid isomerase-like protein